MNKILSVFKSRTVLVLIALFVINGIGGVRENIPVAYLPIIDAVLGLAGVYFRINPRQRYQ